MSEFRGVIDEYENRFLVGESSDIRFLGDGSKHLHSIFNFDLTFQAELTASIVRENHEKWRAMIPAQTWQSNTLNNHDQSRVATHFATGEHKHALCRITAALPLFLEGIPFLYYGEEIGMEDYAIQSLDELRDMVGGVYRRLRLADGASDAEIVQELGKFSRDRCRTPMQWDASTNAGFSPAGASTWLPVHANHTAMINVASQENDAQSLLHDYRNLIALRNQNLALQVGTFEDIDSANEDALVFLRKADTQTCLVALNFSEKSLALSYDGTGQVLYSTTQRESAFAGNQFDLAPFEVLVVALN